MQSEGPGSISGQVREQARRAQGAARLLAQAGSAAKDAALANIARGLVEGAAAILAANRQDLEDARNKGLSGVMLRRLELSEQKLAAIAQGVRAVINLPDPIGEVMAEWSRPNGLTIQKVRVPIGVIGIIFESRPNVTIDAAVLCLKAGSAALLKGGSEAVHANAALTAVIRRGLAEAGLPPDGAQLVGGGREGARALMECSGLVDLLIPRGGAGLIQTVVQNARVPVVETGVGVCHVYVAADADLTMARAVALNAKLSNPAVCNAMETLLVDRQVAGRFLPGLAADLLARGVALKGCPEAVALVPQAAPAGDDAFATEYNDLVLNLKVVDGLDDALSHIARFGSRHSDSIITSSAADAERFLNSVDGAAVYWNASTRFTDGFEFGFGAEIGISTQKTHARGPMGLAEITSYKFKVRGSGQVR